MKNPFRYFGPQSPWGPTLAGCMCWIVGFPLFVLLFPPFWWVVSKWWGYWLK